MSGSTVSSSSRSSSAAQQVTVQEQAHVAPQPLSTPTPAPNASQFAGLNRSPSLVSMRGENGGAAARPQTRARSASLGATTSSAPLTFGSVATTGLHGAEQETVDDALGHQSQDQALQSDRESIKREPSPPPKLSETALPKDAAPLETAAETSVPSGSDALLAKQGEAAPLEKGKQKEEAAVVEEQAKALPTDEAIVAKKQDAPLPKTEEPVVEQHPAETSALPKETAPVVKQETEALPRDEGPVIRKEAETVIQQPTPSSSQNEAAVVEEQAKALPTDEAAVAKTQDAPLPKTEKTAVEQHPAETSALPKEAAPVVKQETEALPRDEGPVIKREAETVIQQPTPSSSQNEAAVVEEQAKTLSKDEAVVAKKQDAPLPKTEETAVEQPTPSSSQNEAALVEEQAKALPKDEAAVAKKQDALPAKTKPTITFTPPPTVETEESAASSSSRDAAPKLPMFKKDLESPPQTPKSALLSPDTRNRGASSSSSSAPPPLNPDDVIETVPRKPKPAVTTSKQPPQTPQTPVTLRDQGAALNTLARTGGQNDPANTFALRRGDGVTDLESGSGPDSGRRTQSRLQALGTGMKALPAQMWGAAKGAPGAIKSGVVAIAKNEFGAGDPWKGWGSNFANSLVHELLITGVSTGVFRELTGLATQAVIDRTNMSPEARAMGVVGVYTVATCANILGMVHKHYQGRALPTTMRGHMIQIGALLTPLIAAGVFGRGGENGQFGLLAQLLPNALKSIAYVSRDVMNLGLPLNGNHDELYTEPVTGQVRDGSYLVTEGGVNAAQDFAGLSGAGALDAVMSHVLSAGQAVGKVFGYSVYNAGGEAIANVSLRVANETARGSTRAEKWQGIKDLRLSWGVYSKENGSFGSQLADKMAGPGLARASLFLSLYAMFAILGHGLGLSKLSSKNQLFIEEWVGAALIVAGCIPFAMSTHGKPRTNPNAANTNAPLVQVTTEGGSTIPSTPATGRSRANSTNSRIEVA